MYIIQAYRREILKRMKCVQRWPRGDPQWSGGVVAGPGSFQGSLCTTVSDTTVMSLDGAWPLSTARICSSLPHAVVSGMYGGLLFFFLSLFVVWRPRLESGYVFELVGRPELLKKTLPSPNLLKALRIIGWIIGRFDTMMDTKVSRQAHRLPEIAPSGPA